MKRIGLLLILAGLLAGCDESSTLELIHKPSTGNNEDNKTEKIPAPAVISEKCDGDGIACDGDILVKCVSEQWTISPQSRCSQESVNLCSDNTLIKTACKHCRFVNGAARCMDCSKGSECDSGVCEAGECKTQTVTPCTNSCVQGDKKCENGKSVICKDSDGDGCLNWADPVDCPQDTVCKAGVCESSSQPATCTDECSEQGALRCSDNGYQSCGNTDDDSCLEWSETVPCQPNETCNGGHCESTGPTCTNKCNTGDKQCSGTAGYQICELKSDGCYDWSEVTACGTGKECKSGSCENIAVNAPVRYLADRIHSPITPYVVSKMQEISAKNTGRVSNRFMKIGDSHMAFESAFVKCFSTDSTVNLDSHTDISAAVSSFKNGFDCYGRNSATTKIGANASYPYESYNGSTRLKSEISDTNPRFAFFGYGTNDMGFYGYNKKKSGNNAGYSASMQLYYRNVLKNARDLMNNGIIPLFIGVGVRTDSPSVNSPDGKPGYYVTTFNAIQRGVAEAYQFPYMNLQKVLLAIGSAHGYGLAGDGIHTSSGGGSACTFTSSALSQYGMNNRNLYSMEMLNRAWGALYNGGSVPDASSETFKGSGSPTDPWEITSLPFTHSANTKNSPHSILSNYSCGNANEGGPEYYYKMVLTAPTKIRAFVVSDTGADLDIHIKTSASDSNCLDRDDIWFEKTLDAGTYYFVIDTFVDGGTAQKGEYLFGVHACDADDPYCG